MILRKPISALCASSLHNIHLNSPQCTASSQTRGHRRKLLRTYATASDPPINNDLLTWPSPKPPATLPTPYDILACAKSAPYTKKRYYELVKLYHPDRSTPSHTHSSICSLPAAIRLERYRLIVNAHEILSDPQKRRAYDSFGVGWGGQPELRAGPFSQRYGSDGYGGREREDMFRNATWEDWERFYSKSDSQGQRPQAPVYISNMAFVGLIAMFAALGGIGQATRAQTNGQKFVERADFVHDQTSKQLMNIRKEAKGLTREERIEAFVRRRDASMGAEGRSEEEIRKLLPDMEFCSSDDVARRPPEFWSRNKKNRERSV